MKPDDTRHLEQLGRRERQIMDVIYRKGRATVAEIRAELPDPPTYSAVRGMLRFLEDKGYLRHDAEGPRYVYGPTADPKQGPWDGGPPSGPHLLQRLREFCGGR